MLGYMTRAIVRTPLVLSMQTLLTPTECFRHEFSRPKVIRIWEYYVKPCFRRNSWLILGSKWNVLIDTGCGMGNLAEYVEPWVKKPLTAIATNTHFDLSGGLADFPDTAMHSTAVGFLMQREVMAPSSLQEQKIQNADRYSVTLARRFSDDTFNLRPTNIKRKLNDGDVIDIGSRHFQVIHIRGLSLGMIVLFEAERKELFCGDLLQQNSNSLLMAALNPQQYAQSLEQVASLNISTAFPAAGRPICGDHLRKKIHFILKRRTLC